MLFFDVINVTTWVACGLALIALQVLLGCALWIGVKYLCKAAIKDCGLLFDETKRTIKWVLDIPFAIGRALDK